MKRHFILILAVMMLSAGFLSSCKKKAGGSSDLSMLLPADASMVVKVNLAQLNSKTDFDIIKKSEMWDMVDMGVAMSGVKQLKKVANDLNNTGLDFKSDMYVAGFSSGAGDDMNFCTLIPVHDRKVFESLLQDAGQGSMSFENKAGVSVMNQGGQVVCWNDKALVAVNAGYRNSEASQAMALSILNSNATASPAYSETFANDHDMCMWMDYENMSKMITTNDSFSEIDLKELPTGFEYAMHSNMVKGGFDMGFDLVAKDEASKKVLSDLYAGGTDNTLLDKLGENAMGVFSANVKPDALNEWFEKFNLKAQMRQEGMSEEEAAMAEMLVDNFMSLINGQVAMSLLPSGSDEPNINLLIGVKDSDATREFIGQLIEMGLLSASEDGYAVIEHGEAYIAVHDGFMRIFSGTDMDMQSGFPFSAEIRKNAASMPAYGYIDFDKNNEVWAGMDDQVLEMLDYFELRTENLKGNTMSGSMKIVLNDKTEYLSNIILKSVVGGGMDIMDMFM